MFSMDEKSLVSKKKNLFVEELQNRFKSKSGPEPPKLPIIEPSWATNTHVCLLCLQYRPWVLCVPATVKRCAHVGWVCVPCLKMAEEDKDFCGFCIGPITWPMRGVNLYLLPNQKKESEAPSTLLDLQKEDNIKQTRKGWFM